MNDNIFIACPISKFFEGGTTLRPDFKAFIQEIRRQCLLYSPNVFLALDREKYGDALMPPRQCVPLDLEAMRKADHVIFFPEDSSGVAVEVGWASALEKRMLLFLDQRFRHSPLVQGIDTVARATVVEYEHSGYVESLPFVVERIRRFLGDAMLEPRAPKSHVASSLLSAMGTGAHE